MHRVRTVAAGEVFRLLGARDIGDQNDYRVAKMPPVNTSLLDGELAWRQHDGGHEDRSNMSFFINWANKLIHYRGPAYRAVRRLLSTNGQESRSTFLTIFDKHYSAVYDVRKFQGHAVPCG